ncbi:MAG TPA: DUF3617 domain-containing protein [Bryobacteraceae bacterium]
MRTFLIAGVATLLPLASLSLADDLKMFDAKPGLWETVSTTQMEGMPAMPQIPPEKLAQMPPEARARVEAMMKNAGGAPRTSTSRSCQTKESLNRGMSLNNQPDCTQKVVTSTSSRIQVHVECSPARGGKSVGDLTLDRLDSGHAKGNMVMKINSSGREMTMNMTFDSKFVSSDCGDVKPYTPK